MKIEVQQTFEPKTERRYGKQVTENPAKIKLSKLIITKFKDKDLDLSRFWSQFETNRLRLYNNHKQLFMYKGISLLESKSSN